MFTHFSQLLDNNRDVIFHGIFCSGGYDNLKREDFPLYNAIYCNAIYCMQYIVYCILYSMQYIVLFPEFKRVYAKPFMLVSTTYKIPSITQCFWIKIIKALSNLNISLHSAYLYCRWLWSQDEQFLICHSITAAGGEGSWAEPVGDMLQLDTQGQNYCRG